MGPNAAGGTKKEGTVSPYPLCLFCYGTSFVPQCMQCAPVSLPNGFSQTGQRQIRHWNTSMPITATTATPDAITSCPAAAMIAAITSNAAQAQ